MPVPERPGGEIVIPDSASVKAPEPSPGPPNIARQGLRSGIENISPRSPTSSRPRVFADVPLGLPAHNLPSPGFGVTLEVRRGRTRGQGERVCPLGETGTKPVRWDRVRRAGATAGVLLVIVAILLTVPEWLLTYPRSFRARVVEWFLHGVLIAYGLAVLLAGPGTIGFAICAYRAARRRAFRPWMGRGVLVGLSLLLGLMLMELSPASQGQRGLFPEESEDRVTLSRLSDRINDRMGRDTLRLAGSLETGNWRMRRGAVSPAFTTNWRELATVAA